jgi:shikimate kinase
VTVLTPGRNIVLIGLMGAGKTTVGKIVAGELGRPFVDTDEVVEREAGRSIAEIFAEEGERGFRSREATAVRGVAALRGQVIAVGGGAVLDPANRTQLGMTGDLVLLDAAPEALGERLEVAGAGERPLLQGSDDLTARLAELLESRRGEYERSAARVVDTTGREPEDVAGEILMWARTRAGLLARDEAPL